MALTSWLLFRRNFVVIYHGIGKRYLYLNVSVFVVGWACCYFRVIIVGLEECVCTPKPQVPWLSNPGLSSLAASSLGVSFLFGKMRS